MGPEATEMVCDVQVVEGAGNPVRGGTWGATWLVGSTSLKTKGSERGGRQREQPAHDQIVSRKGIRFMYFGLTCSLLFRGESRLREPSIGFAQEQSIEGSVREERLRPR